MAGWHKVHWTYSLTLHLSACHRRLMFLMLVAAAEGGPASAAVWGQRRRSRQQTVDPGIWLRLPQDPQSYCSAGWFFCIRLFFQDMKARLPEAIQCEPVALLSLHLLGDEYIMAKLHCLSLPQSLKWGALISALSSCSVFDVINSVSNRVPGTHADISETASQPAQRPLFKLSCSVHKCQLFSKSPCKKHCIWDHNWRVTHPLTPAQPQVSPPHLWTIPRDGPQKADLALTCRISALQLRY